MTLSELSSLAEVLASLAVVASLIYVAKQLRQTTAMMRANASGQRVQRDADLSLRLADSQEFADLWVKGRADLATLAEGERTRLIFFSRTAIVHWHNMFRLRKQNLLPDSDWHELIWLIKLVMLRQDPQARH